MKYKNRGSVGALVIVTGGIWLLGAIFGAGFHATEQTVIVQQISPPVLQPPTEPTHYVREWPEYKARVNMVPNPQWKGREDVINSPEYKEAKAKLKK